MLAKTKLAGFTIVELLVVIVVIGILATATIVAYNGIQQKATGASLQADLQGASTQLKLYQVDNGAYPTSNDCSAGPTPLPPKICLKSSAGNTYSSYVADNASVPQTFSLIAAHDTTSYVTTHDSQPTLVAAVTSCSTGYILVPGSSTYGTSNFCTMKYEAKNVGGIATSQVAGVPWTAISQTTALTTAAAACAGCHLITESEWMTLAQNVLGVASNWSGGSVGNGYIYTGHSDSAPGNELAANSSDAIGYYGTGNSSPSDQRRTLTLSNGEVIWDLAGNVIEWTSGTSTTGQPGITGEVGYTWKQWSSVTTNGSNPVNPSPTGTGIVGASGWNSNNGIGMLYSSVDESATHGFIRGGEWDISSMASGVLMMNSRYDPSATFSTGGFRVSK